MFSHLFSRVTSKRHFLNVSPSSLFAGRITAHLVAARRGLAAVESFPKDGVSALHESVSNGSRAAKSLKAIRPVSRRYKQFFKLLIPLGLLILVSTVLAAPAMAEFGLTKFEISARNENG
jgi:hypothetical protein